METRPNKHYRDITIPIFLKNAENIKIRKQKLQATTATINTIASSEVLNQVESMVLLELHERISIRIPGFLNNTES